MARVMTLLVLACSVSVNSMAWAAAPRLSRFSVFQNGVRVAADPWLRRGEGINGCTYPREGSARCSGSLWTAWRLLPGGGLRLLGLPDVCGELWLLNEDGRAYFPAVAGDRWTILVEGRVDPRRTTDILVNWDVRDCPDSSACPPQPVLRLDPRRCVAPDWTCAWQHRRPERGRPCVARDGSFRYRASWIVPPAMDGKFVSFVVRECDGCRAP